MPSDLYCKPLLYNSNIVDRGSKLINLLFSRHKPLCNVCIVPFFFVVLRHDFRIMSLACFVMPLFVGVLCVSLFCYAFLCVHSSFEIILKRKKAGCFAIIFLYMYCYYKFSVTLPHGAVGWSAVCDCGISRTPDPDFHCFTLVRYFYLTYPYQPL